MMALSKPDGGVRGIIVGDKVRRLVARTISKQIVKKVEETTAPFNTPSQPKQGVSASLTFCTNSNHETSSPLTVWAYDLQTHHVGRRFEDGEWRSILPFVWMFYGSPHLWEDEMGVVQHIPQGEGGEQGDPLMPMLFALGQHQALVQTQARLRNNEKVMAFLDDIHIASPQPDRVMEADTVVAEELWSNANIQVHLGKTQVWNRGGFEPAGMEVLTRVARLVRCRCLERGSSVAGTSTRFEGVGSSNGSPEYVREFLQRKSGEQKRGSRG